MEQYEDRASNKIKTLFTDEGSIPFLLSASDIGVQRNFGRNGARFAPQAIVAQFQNLTKHSADNSFRKISVSKQDKEQDDFVKAQEFEANEIKQQLLKKSSKKVIHLGGGHDHVYPLLKAAEESGFDKIFVFNIDAHCDTRKDEAVHSGTPFRQFDNETKVVFRITQYGIHKFANSTTTLEPLKNAHDAVYFDEAIAMDYVTCEKHLKTFFDSWEESALFVLSLDCDAIDASLMEGVSAVNHRGINTEKIVDLVKIFKGLEGNATKCLGIYEYNPIYDNLSNKGSRFLAGLIHEFIF